MTDLMVLELKPLDVLMFRDGRPFSFTDFASTLPTPLPSTTAGALRKLFGDILKLEGDEWTKILGNSEKSSLIFTGPFLKKKDEMFVNIPKIFLTPKKEGRKGVFKLERFSKIVGRSDLLDLSKSSLKTSDVPWDRDITPKESAEGFIEFSKLVNVLNGSSHKNLKLFPIDEFLSFEIRTHIRIVGKTVVEKGGKFSVRYVSLKEGVSLIIGVERGDLNKNLWQKLENTFKSEKRFIIRLGGEAKQVIVEEATCEFLDTFRVMRELENSSDNTRVFITPLALRGNLESLRFAVTSKSRIIRGMDLNRFSKFFKVYDAGSVLEFEDFENLRNSNDFRDLRSLGYNVSLKGGFLI